MKVLLVAMFTLVSFSASAGDFKVSCSDGSEILPNTVLNKNGMEKVITSLIEKNISLGYSASHAPSSSLNSSNSLLICVTSIK